MMEEPPRRDDNDLERQKKHHLRLLIVVEIVIIVVLVFFLIAELNRSKPKNDASVDISPSKLDGDDIFASKLDGDDIFASKLDCDDIDIFASKLDGFYLGDYNDHGIEDTKRRYPDLIRVGAWYSFYYDDEKDDFTLRVSDDYGEQVWKENKKKIDNRHYRMSLFETVGTGPLTPIGNQDIDERVSNFPKSYPLSITLEDYDPRRMYIFRGEDDYCAEKVSHVCVTLRGENCAEKVSDVCVPKIFADRKCGFHEDPFIVYMRVIVNEYPSERLSEEAYECRIFLSNEEEDYLRGRDCN